MLRKACSRRPVRHNPGREIHAALIPRPLLAHFFPGFEFGGGVAERVAHLC
jgi:hypothetical protein